ncbi:MAG: hypothetical protein HRU05_19620 [Oceanospirillaceae bacterium]|nr:hypothetical protein [Oceanospirillaceae bacterium]
MEDIKLAIRDQTANADKYHLNPERNIVSGASAVSYLAVMVGVTGNSKVFSDQGLYPNVASSVRAGTVQSAPMEDFTLQYYADRPMVKRLLPVGYADFNNYSVPIIGRYVSEIMLCQLV